MNELRRGIAETLELAVASFPVVVLEGGRAVGKSTLCRSLAHKNHWAAPIDLTDSHALAEIQLDPLRFLRGLRTPVVIDEAQIVPEVTLWVKRLVDERGGTAGQFVLTGSARLGRDQLGGSDPLAGRSVRLRMWSMTPSEQLNSPTPLAARLFTSDWDVANAPDPARASVAHTVGHDDEVGTTSSGRSASIPNTADSIWDVRTGLLGGLPGIPGVLRPADNGVWERAMSAYVESVIPLGVGSTRIDHARLLRAFRYLASNPGQQLSLTRMASELGIKSETARNYIEILEACFLVFRAEAHRPTEAKVLTAHPRIFATDLGLACWASRLDPEIPLTAVQTGSFLENQIAHALSASTDWSPQRITLRHWRDQRSQREVDLLLVHSDGRTAPMEIKSSTTVSPSDTIGLLAFASENPHTFHRGYLAYCGTRTVDLTPPGMRDRSILAVPISHLLS